MRTRSICICAALNTLCTATLLAQSPVPFQSSEPNPDRSVTFRYQDPAATKVVLNIDTAAKPIPMVKGADGLWTYTTPPLAPEIYSYSFDVDGRPQFDPNNLTRIPPNLVYRGNQVEVPADAPQLWDTQNVPHGELHRHRYTTGIVKGIAANTSEYIVYTPPGYDARAKTRYPVLYLLHGWSNTVDTWSKTLQADLILDNLLAGGKIRPMVVVMPLGYGDMSFINGPIGEIWKQRPLVDRNTDLVLAGASYRGDSAGGGRVQRFEKEGRQGHCGPVDGRARSPAGRSEPHRHVRLDWGLFGRRSPPRPRDSAAGSCTGECSQGRESARSVDRLRYG